MTTIERSWPPPSEMEVARFEREIAARLPEDYRRFLLIHNGGRPRPAIFTSYDLHTRQPAGEEMVNKFSPLADDEYTDLRNTRSVFAGRVPDGFLPIARDPGGNLICLSLRASDYGAVYFWDHEREASEGETADMRNILYVARSFGEFLDSLREPEPAGQDRNAP